MSIIVDNDNVLMDLKIEVLDDKEEADPVVAFHVDHQQGKETMVVPRKD